MTGRREPRKEVRKWQNWDQTERKHNTQIVTGTTWLCHSHKFCLFMSCQIYCYSYFKILTTKQRTLNLRKIENWKSCYFWSNLITGILVCLEVSLIHSLIFNPTIHPHFNFLHTFNLIKGDGRLELISAFIGQEAGCLFLFRRPGQISSPSQIHPSRFLSL